MTPYLLILFSFLGENNIDIVKERIIDTVVGSAIALMASYFVFPSWEYKQLKNAMRKALIANYQYLLKLAEGIHGKALEITDYKLIRKEVYVSSANLGSAFQRMLAEPRQKQRHSKIINKFTVLNHMLSSYVANLMDTVKQGKKQEINPAHIKWLRKALFNLNESIKALETDNEPPFEANYPELPQSYKADVPDGKAKTEQDWNDHLLNEQLQLCYKLTKDIRKLAGSLANSNSSESES